jgi:hypothetical protein
MCSKFCNCDNFLIFWPIFLKFGLLLTPKCYNPQCSNFQKSKMEATGWRPSWIFVITITFKPLDQSFRNLLSYFGPAITVLPATFKFSKIQDGGCRRAAVWHFFYRDNFKLFEQSIWNLVGVFTPSRAKIFDVQILLKSMTADSWFFMCGGLNTCDK